MFDTALRWVTRLQGRRLPLRHHGGPHARPDAATARGRPVRSQSRPSTFTAKDGTRAAARTTSAMSRRAQDNLAGTGIGSFNDRIRDAVRGGGRSTAARPCSNAQGITSGLLYDPNSANSGAASEKTALLDKADRIRCGQLAGGIKSYTFQNAAGTRWRGSTLGSYAGRSVRADQLCRSHDNRRSGTSASTSIRPATPTGRPRACAERRHVVRAAGAGRARSCTRARKSCAPSRRTRTHTTPATGSTISTGRSRRATGPLALPPQGDNQGSKTQTHAASARSDRRDRAVRSSVRLRRDQGMARDPQELDAVPPAHGGPDQGAHDDAQHGTEPAGPGCHRVPPRWLLESGAATRPAIRRGRDDLQPDQELVASWRSSRTKRSRLHPVLAAVGRRGGEDRDTRCDLRLPRAAPHDRCLHQDGAVELLALRRADLRTRPGRRLDRQPGTRADLYRRHVVLAERSPWWRVRSSSRSPTTTGPGHRTAGWRRAAVTSMCAKPAALLCDHDSRNINLTPPAAGDYTFSLEAADKVNPVLTVSKAAPFGSTTMYVREAFNDWGMDRQPTAPMAWDGLGKYRARSLNLPAEHLRVQGRGCRLDRASNCGAGAGSNVVTIGTAVDADLQQQLRQSRASRSRAPARTCLRSTERIRRRRADGREDSFRGRVVHARRRDRLGLPAPTIVCRTWAAASTVGATRQRAGADADGGFKIADADWTDGSNCGASTAQPIGVGAAAEVRRARERQRRDYVASDGDCTLHAGRDEHHGVPC